MLNITAVGVCHIDTGANMGEHYNSIFKEMQTTNMTNNKKQ